MDKLRTMLWQLSKISTSVGEKNGRTADAHGLSNNYILVIHSYVTVTHGYMLQLSTVISYNYIHYTKLIRELDHQPEYLITYKWTLSEYDQSSLRM